MFLYFDHSLPLDLPQVVLNQEEKETERKACDRASKCERSEAREASGSTRPDIANVRRTLRKSAPPPPPSDWANILIIRDHSLFMRGDGLAGSGGGPQF